MRETRGDMRPDTETIKHPPHKSVRVNKINFRFPMVICFSPFSNAV